MVLWKRLSCTYITGLYIFVIVVVYTLVFMIVVVPQWTHLGCMDCGSVKYSVDDLGQDIEEPPLITVSNNLLRKRIASIPQYPFSNVSYAFLEPKNACSNEKDPLLVVLIHSSPYHFKRRNTIRRTWTNSTYFRHVGPIVRLFLFGTVNSSFLQAYIETEHKYYNDILQGTFIDNYYNLSFNTMMGLQWVHKKCSHAKVVMKVDDDIVIDMFTFVPRFVLSFASNSNHVLCTYERRVITRQKSTKWFIERNQFKGQKYYPLYCEGKIVMMTRDIVSKLYNLAFETDFFFIEDVYFYGFVMNKIQKRKIIKMKWTIDFQLNGTVARDCLIKKKKCSYYAAGVSSEQNMEEIWSLFSQRGNVTFG